MTPRQVQRTSKVRCTSSVSQGRETYCRSLKAPSFPDNLSTPLTGCRIHRFGNELHF